MKYKLEMYKAFTKTQTNTFHAKSTKSQMTAFEKETIIFNLGLSRKRELNLFYFFYFYLLLPVHTIEIDMYLMQQLFVC